MAKKSVASKGYRKEKKNKSGYSPKEIRIMIAIAVAFVLVMAAVLLIPKCVVASKKLPMKDGLVQNVGDNWLVSNMDGELAGGTAYRKLCEVEPAEGFAFKEKTIGAYDPNTWILHFEPTEESGIKEYMVMPGKGEAAALATNYSNQMMGYAYTLNVGAIETDTVNGIKVTYLVTNFRNTVSGEGDDAVYEYEQDAVLYVPAAFADHAVVLNAVKVCNAQDELGDGAELVELLKQAVGGIKLAK